MERHGELSVDQPPFWTTAAIGISAGAGAILTFQKIIARLRHDEQGKEKKTKFLVNGERRAVIDALARFDATLDDIVRRISTHEAHDTENQRILSDIQRRLGALERSIVAPSPEDS